jgi:S1-C subfamily serine protease
VAKWLALLQASFISNETIYLVTNRHVVVDETRGLKADALRIRLHTNSQDLTKNVDRELPLYQNGKQKWYVHKDYPKVPIDIAVIELSQEQIKDGQIKALSQKNFFPDRLLISPGEDVMVMGFPRGLSDSKHNLPLIRNALISSAYGVNFEGLPTFLVDANLHPGMSGSPVMTKPKNVWATKQGGTSMVNNPVAHLLGVFSATLSINISPTEQEALGLGQVWYAELIEQIIDGIKR